MPNFAWMFLNILTTAPLMVSLMVTIQLILEQRHRKDHLLRWLIVWGVSATLLYCGHFFYFHHAIQWIPWTNTIYVAANLSVYPLYLIYLSDLTDEHPISAHLGKLAWLLGPAILFSISTGVLYALMTEQERMLYIEQMLYADKITGLKGLPLLQAILHDLNRVLFPIQVVGVAFIGIRKVRRYNHTVSQLYADTEGKEAAGLAPLLKLFIVTASLSFVFNIIGRSYFDHSEWLILPALLFSTLIFAIGWMGLNQRFSIRNINIMSEDTTVTQGEEKEQNHNKKFVSKDMLFAQFEELVHSKKLFLEHDLRLEQVARMLGTNRTYLLTALNSCMHMTFKEYINRLRINYAEQLMTEDPTLSKNDVAMRSGYNTLSSFYRNYNTYRSQSTLKEQV